MKIFFILRAQKPKLFFLKTKFAKNKVIFWQLKRIKGKCRWNFHFPKSSLSVHEKCISCEGNGFTLTRNHKVIWKTFTLLARPNFYSWRRKPKRKRKIEKQFLRREFLLAVNSRFTKIRSHFVVSTVTFYILYILRFDQSTYAHALACAHLRRKNEFRFHFSWSSFVSYKSHPLARSHLYVQHFAELNLSRLSDKSCYRFQMLCFGCLIRLTAFFAFSFTAWQTTTAFT